MADIVVEVEGRRLGLSNLDKVLYPRTGTTKGEVIDYYARIAPDLLPHLARACGDPEPLARRGRGPAVLREERPAGTPAWVRTADAAEPGLDQGPRDSLTYVVVDDLPTLVWWPTWPRWSCTSRSGGWSARGVRSRTGS